MIFIDSDKFCMENNVGEADQYIRIALGALTGIVSIGILANYVGLAEIYSPVLGVLSLILLVTAFTGKCGLYSAVGIDTCKVN